jgi:short-subunit dehydrogenase
VNNVGIANDIPVIFHKMDREEMHSIVNVNTLSLLDMTKTVIPFMVDRKKGAIINVSSGAGNDPVPYLSVYGSTKAFMTLFAKNLYYENVYKEFFL